MKNKKFPISQVTISNKIGRPINSIVRMSNLKDFYIRPDLFLHTFADFFDELPEKENASTKNTSITFNVYLKGLTLFMEKEEGTDFPIDYFFKKAFLPKPIHHFFGTILSQFYRFIKNELSQDFANIEIQFVREKVVDGTDKIMVFENSNFEGSIILLNQENISGGESQILEKKDDGSLEVIFQQKLGAGDFVFLKNKNGHLQNISHQLTSIKLADESKKIGWIDFIRFEIIE